MRVLPVEAAGGDTDVAPLRIELTTTVSIRAFSLVLESEDGILRVPWLLPAHPVLVGEDWPSDRWGRLGGINYLHHPEADPSVVVPPMGFLITGGRVVVNRGLRGVNKPTPAGVHVLEAKARLPFGAAAGRYALRVLETSQVLLEDGSLVRPVVDGESEIIVAEEVAVGWSRALPPLRGSSRRSWRTHRPL